MRKLLLGLLVSSCSVFAYGQHASQKLSTEDEKPAEVTPVSAEELQVTTERNLSQPWGESAPGDIIWEEDFSGGIPGSWTNAGTVANIWEYRGPSTTPDTSTGSRGAFGDTRIESPTWTNGWVIFDSDYLDNGGDPTDIGGGSVPSPHYGQLITETIDLSSHAEVVLEFYQYIRFLQTETYIVFSSDDGVTWPDSVRINNSFPIVQNVGSNVDDYVSIDASPYIGGSSTAKIQFLFAPSSATALCYYNWQLDDIRLIEKPNNDLGIDVVAAVQDGRFGEFGKIPQDQIDQIEFQSLITNYGQVDQPGTSVTVDVQGPQTFNDATSGFLAEKDSSYILTNTNLFSPSTLGQYLVTYTLESDSTDIDPDGTGFRENNNERMVAFEVTDSIFSLATDAARTSLGTNSFTDNEDGFRMANLIELIEPAMITSVTLGLTSTTEAGSSVEITVRDTMPNFDYVNGFQNVVCQSDIYLITAQDVANGFVTIPIPAVLNTVPQDRTLAADWYYISAELYSSGGSADIRILDDYTIQQSFFSSIIYLATDTRWYTNGNAFHIAANLSEPVGLEDDNAVNFDYSVHPNPAQDFVTVAASSPTNVEFTVVITNIAGQIIKSERYGNTNSINSNIDVSELPAGIYTVQVYAGNEMAVRKLVVE